MCMHGSSTDAVKLSVQVDVLQATNVLDRWICAASRSLTSFVRREMGAYRLYTVVPFLVCCSLNGA